MKTIIFANSYTHMVLIGRIEIVINKYNPNLINIFHGPERGYVALKDAGTLKVRNYYDTYHRTQCSCTDLRLVSRPRTGRH